MTQQFNKALMILAQLESEAETDAVQIETLQSSQGIHCSQTVRRLKRMRTLLTAHNVTVKLNSDLF